MDKHKNIPDASEMNKKEIHFIVEIIEYMPNSVLNRIILKKDTGNITVSAFAAGEELVEKTLPFDNYIQIIDGVASITIDNKLYKLTQGQGIIIPAHSTHCFSADEQFKMISTIIKSGYED